MFQTQQAASGVGLAAPQIGRSIRLFVVDASGFAREGEQDYELLKDFKEVFINPKIVEEVERNGHLVRVVLVFPK